MKYFPWIAAVFVALAIIVAFFLIGSPAHARLLRLDAQRLADLQNIQYQVTSYFSSKGKLPAALSEANGFNGFAAPVDPESGKEYEYAARTEKSFRLCADFALASEDLEKGSLPPGRGSYLSPALDSSVSWVHPAGRGCFDLSIEQPVSDRGFKEPPAVTVKPAAD